MNAERLILGQLKNFSNVGSFGNIMKYIPSFLAPLRQIIDWFIVALMYWGLIFIFRNKQNTVRFLL
ncbi:unnamed protein product [marine sediment metagenome]|uniref:Uncharacterized protein n=1 Tax=marine sediment metagenome TaxID=412755 RepID=X1UDP8_9ZZZZ